MLSWHEAGAVNDTYKTFVHTIIEKINGTLYFGGNELVMVGIQFIARKIGAKVEMQVSKIRSIDRKYIRSISYLAMDNERKRTLIAP